ncbi:MAG: response regulator transcription factor [Chloroflexi bacterium]|nr:response regulator transcription factor [Chloroflexota bacterium]
MIRVVIADTQQLFCAGIQAILSNIEDIDFLNGANCNRAFISFCHNTQPDVVLIALNMVQDEPNILQSIHQSFPQTKTVLLLAAQDDFNFNWLMTLDVAGMLQKEDTSTELETAIKSVMQGHRWISPSIIHDYTQLATHPLIGLTDRELDILNMVATENTDKQIALSLNISERTVRTHLQHICAKLDVNTRVGAAVQATRLNLI